MKDLAEQCNIAVGFVPVNMATGANTGDWFDASGFGKVAILFFKGAGAAGEDPTITVLQGTTSAGGSTAALNFTTIYKKQGAALTAIEQWTKVTQTAANTFTHADLAEQQAIILIEIDTRTLTDGYRYINASVADVGDTSQIGCLLYKGLEPRYGGSSLPGSQS